MRILKFKLELVDIQTLELPHFSEILTVQVQGDSPQLWALCDDEQEIKVLRRIAIYGTGMEITGSPGDYISTFQMHGGLYVFHVFEIETGETE